jgi:hypothetical protein
LNRVKRLRQLRAGIPRKLALLLDLRQLIADLSLDVADGGAGSRAVIVRFLVGVMDSILDIAEQRRHQTGVCDSTFSEPMQLRGALGGEGRIQDGALPGGAGKLNLHRLAPIAHRIQR